VGAMRCPLADWPRSYFPTGPKDIQSSIPALNLACLGGLAVTEDAAVPNLWPSFPSAPVVSDFSTYEQFIRYDTRWNY
jgi:hypothetical protein